jgi:hypothetical protein
MAGLVPRSCSRRPVTIPLSKSNGAIGSFVGVIAAWSSFAIFERLFRDELAAALTSSLVLVVWLTVLGKKGMLATDVAVGADGIVVRGLGYERVVPYASVRSVDYGNRGVIVRLHDGTEIALSTMSIAFPKQSETTYRDRILDRAQRDFTAFRAAPPVPAGAALLARGGRSPEAWRRACGSAVAEEAAGYRTASLSAEEVVEILENPAAPIELRAGAALALSPSSDPALRERVHAAIEACVAPRTAEVLGAAERGEVNGRALDRARRAELRTAR